LAGSAAEWWAKGETLQRFLAHRAAEWWVAVADSQIVGYGRSIECERHGAGPIAAMERADLARWSALGVV
jgi:hypothetical protein